MQIKVLSVPVIGGEEANEQLNAFLRSKKVPQVESQLVSFANTACWSFCIKYVETSGSSEASFAKPKTDYKQVLDEETFKRFSQMREVRKILAKADAVPAYAVFTDEELAKLAKLPVLNEQSMRSVKGIGEKKMEKYGEALLKAIHTTHEENRAPD